MEAACGKAGVVGKRGGTYLCMEGPQFSTRAESNLYRSWGMDVIGMTNLQEAKLAREAEICYATLAMVTDYDCWHPAARLRHRRADRRGAEQERRQCLQCGARGGGGHAAERGCKCGSALAYAILTDREQDSRRQPGSG